MFLPRERCNFAKVPVDVLGIGASIIMFDIFVEDLVCEGGKFQFFGDRSPQHECAIA